MSESSNIKVVETEDNIEVKQSVIDTTEVIDNSFNEDKSVEHESSEMEDDNDDEIGDDKKKLI